MLKVFFNNGYYFRQDKSVVVADATSGKNSKNLSLNYIECCYGYIHKNKDILADNSNFCLVIDSLTKWNLI